MSIKTRMGALLLAVLALHAFTAVMGHVGLSKSKRDMQRLERLNADTISVLAIDRSVTELQHGVGSFMLTGHTAAADRVRDLLGAIGEQIDRSLREHNPGEEHDRLRRMAEFVGTYGENFEKVAEDRAERIRLMNEEMFPTRDQILHELRELDERTGSFAANPSTDATRSLLLAEAAAMRYFDSPNGERVGEAIEHLREAKRLSTEVSGRVAADPAVAGASEIESLFEAYEQAFLEAVQATRGYLHLVNVVLAGNASELLYEADRVRSASLEQRQMLSAQMQSESSRFQVISDTIAVSTILAGLGLGSLLTRSVLVPILGMTKTFRKLAEGHADAEIAGQERCDEIGAMAKAAEVFRLKNIQTEELLHESGKITEDLRQRNSEMTQFVYTVSHDLKSPLVTIHGFSGLLRQAVEDGDRARAESAFVRIGDAVDRMHATLDDLLELSRIGIVVSEPTNVPLGKLFADVVEDLNGEIRSAGATVTVTASDAAVWGDRGRIRQVVQNLVQNALKYCRPTEGDPRVWVGARCDEWGTTITVRDNGEGVPDEFALKIFGIFERLSSDSAGTGVGLAIVRKIAEAHGGRAWLDRHPDGGPEFCVYFPDGLEPAMPKSAA